LTRPFGTRLYSLRSPSHPRASRPGRVTIPRVVASLRGADGEPASVALDPGPAALLRARRFARLRPRRRLVGASRPRKGAGSLPPVFPSRGLRHEHIARVLSAHAVPSRNPGFRFGEPRSLSSLGSLIAMPRPAGAIVGVPAGDGRRRAERRTHRIDWPATARALPCPPPWRQTFARSGARLMWSRQHGSCCPAFLVKRREGRRRQGHEGR